MDILRQPDSPTTDFWLNQTRLLIFCDKKYMSVHDMLSLALFNGQSGKFIFVLNSYPKTLILDAKWINFCQFYWMYSFKKFWKSLWETFEYTPGLPSSAHPCPYETTPNNVSDSFIIQTFKSSKNILWWKISTKE